MRKHSGKSMIKLIKSTFYHELQTKIKLMWFIFWAKQLSFGKKCEEFEKKFALWQGRKEAVFVNSGSSANLALIQSLLNLGRIKKGDRVGFSALGWSTTVMPLLELGLKPVPIDIELNTLNISSNIPNVKVLFVTNLLGGCGDMENIVKNKNYILLEDNCESLGTVYKGKKLGNFGLASTFSFYVGHHLSTIEGGMVCTDDKELAQELRIVRAHGWDRNLTIRGQKEKQDLYSISPFYSRYTFYSNGYNLRPTEINGYLGIVQLPYLNEIIKKRQENYERITGKKHPFDVFSNFAIPLIFKTSDERDMFVEKYKKVLEMRPIVGGDLTQQPFYGKSKHMKNAMIIHNRGLYIGNNPELTKKEIERIGDIIKECASHILT